MFQWSLDDSWILIASKKEILESETAMSLTAGSFLGVSSPHAVLSRPGEGGPQVLGLDECQETVTWVSLMLTGAPNRVRVDRHRQRQSKGGG